MVAPLLGFAARLAARKKAKEIAQKKIKKDIRKSLKTKSTQQDMDATLKMFKGITEGIPKAEREAARQRLLIKTKIARDKLKK